MVVRMRWELDDTECIEIENKGETLNHKNRNEIQELIDTDSLHVHFQPIVSSNTGGVYGYEALSRPKKGNKFNNITDIFSMAKRTGTVSLLDIYCRKNAIANASRSGFKNRDSHLFINTSPETLMSPENKKDITEHFLDEFEIDKGRIIFEITEAAIIHNYELFKSAILHYKSQGYKIAIDDFGAGYGGLKMLSIIEPDFVKIDRFFISHINKALVKSNIVDAIVTTCHRMGVKVIAEGVQTDEELLYLNSMNIEFLQGDYLCPASHGLDYSPPIDIVNKKANQIKTGSNPESNFIGEIVRPVPPFTVNDSILTAVQQFLCDPLVTVLPIVEAETLIGILSRKRFFENDVVGQYGFAMALNYKKHITSLMEPPSLVVEFYDTIEEVSQKCQTRNVKNVYEDICVTKHGKYYGIVPVNELLRLLTQKSIQLAKGANPLTGLPGNEFIQREITKRLVQKKLFDVCYIDIDNFKPYNDYYGFERGDYIIKSLAEILTRIDSENEIFIGHIGGDDFILIAHPANSIKLCEMVIDDFRNRLEDFLGKEDFERASYTSINREGIYTECKLLSLSIGIVSSEVYSFQSYAELASLASEMKKAAKKKDGFSIVRDRRLLG